MTVFSFLSTNHGPGDGRLMLVTWDGQPPVQRAIDDDAIADLAERFLVPAAHLDAVLDVETRGSGFLLSEPPPARPKILFEAHWFYRLTPHPVSQTRPDLSTPHWNPKLYKGGSAEWTRLKDAMDIDPKQALKSASWGLGQVMGFNYTAAGCDTIEQFVEEEFTSEALQLQHALKFCEANSLLDELREGDWAGFARGYNGAAYKSNRYDVRLAEAAKCSRFT